MSRTRLWEIFDELVNGLSPNLRNILNPIENPFTFTNFERPNPIYSSTKSFDIEIDDYKGLVISKIVPNFVKDSLKVFKNTIKLSNYNEEFSTSSAFPYSNKNVASYINPLSFNECRISRDGISFYC